MIIIKQCIVLFVLRCRRRTTSCHLLGADMIGRRQRNAAVKVVFHRRRRLLLLLLIFFMHFISTIRKIACLITVAFVG
jgi:hypothetical protein